MLKNSAAALNNTSRIGLVLFRFDFVIDRTFGRKMQSPGKRLPLLLGHVGKWQLSRLGPFPHLLLRRPATLTGNSEILMMSLA